MKVVVPYFDLPLGKIYNCFLLFSNPCSTLLSCRYVFVKIVDFNNSAIDHIVSVSIESVVLYQNSIQIGLISKLDIHYP